MHLELTSRCTLFCPACPRTWFIDKFDRPFPKQDLDIDDLEKFLDCESGYKDSKFLLNGNHGDPIYYPNLIELVKRFRSHKTFQISTNGSHQTSKFWHDLCDLLGPQDTIFFSIDGLEHNNHLYRRNSNWQSIMNAVDIASQSSVQVVWKTLIFSYNENELTQIKELAESKGALFVPNITEKFGDESLRPANTNLINHTKKYAETQNVNTINPRCMSSEYISADGYYWPCCWISTVHTYDQTSIWKERDQWAISTSNLDQKKLMLQNWINDIEQNPKNAHSICKMTCSPGQKLSSWLNKTPNY